MKVTAGMRLRGSSRKHAAIKKDLGMETFLWILNERD